MLNLLFSTSFWYDVLLAVAIVAIVVACIKFPQGRVYLCTILGIVFVALTVYCGVQLQFYYTSEGGIVGKIDSFFHNNQVEVEVEDMEFSLSNIELRDDGQGKYTAQILSPDVVNLAENEKYIVLVNDEPCSMVDNDGRADYIMADYVYTFLGLDRQELCTDTLNLAFAFYNNSTYLNVSTSGGSEAVKYWNYYFNKNTFIVKIAKAEYVPGDKLDKGYGDVSNFPYANYYINEQFYKAQVYHKGDEVKFPSPEDYEKTFLGWSLDGVDTISEYTINSTTNFYAVLSDEENVCTVTYVICRDKHPLDDDGTDISWAHDLSDDVMTVQKVQKGAQLSLPKAAEMAGYTFQSFTLGELLADEIPEGYTVSDNVTIIAHYQRNLNNIKISAVYADNVDKEYEGFVFSSLSTGFPIDRQTESSVELRAWTGYYYEFNVGIYQANYALNNGKVRIMVDGTILPTVTSEIYDIGGGLNDGLHLNLSNVKADFEIKILVEPIKFNVRFKLDSVLGPNIPDVVARDVTFGDAIDVYSLYTAEQRNTIMKHKANGNCTFKGFWDSDGSPDQQFVGVDLHSVKVYRLAVMAASYGKHELYGAYLRFSDNQWNQICRVSYDDETRTFTFYGIYANSNW